LNYLFRVLKTKYWCLIFLPNQQPSQTSGRLSLKPVRARRCCCRCCSLNSVFRN